MIGSKVCDFEIAHPRIFKLESQKRSDGFGGTTHQLLDVFFGRQFRLWFRPKWEDSDIDIVVDGECGVFFEVRSPVLAATESW